MRISRPFRAALGSCLCSAATLAAVPLFVSAMMTSTASAQALDFYDTTILRTVNIQFHDANWWSLLQANYQSQTNILADLTVDGVTYPNVGVRIRGNTSYTALPTGSQKVSLNIDVNETDPNLDVMGYSALNFNNGFHDPTFCREVVYNNFVAQFMPNIRANHVIVTLNGQNWGVYNNVQNYNKDLLRDYFADEDGLRIKCANNPNGPGLRYVGASPSLYSAYEIKDDGGLADPVGTLISVCNAVTNGSTANWQTSIDSVFAVDPSIWSVVLENMLTDDDSYVNKGCDFTTYRNPADGRMHLHQTDANETFTQSTWSPTMNFTAASRPVLSHVLAVAELRQRYMAHYRTVLAHMNWAELEPIFTAHRNLIDAAVQADPKKLYSYTLFQNNFTSTVTLPYSGPAGGTLIGVQQFVTQRLANLNANAELSAKGPTITNVQSSEAFPDPNEIVWITANVAPAAGSGISTVELWYLPQPGVFQRVSMSDNGANHDGAAGDGVYGAALPVTASAGQQVKYYVGGRSTNSFQSYSFAPELAENGPLTLNYSFGSAGIRVSEYMYSGPSGEFIEITNTTSRPIDLTGWSLDDDSAVPGTFSLSAAGVLDPHESIIVTDVAPATFTAAWGLSGVTVLGPNTVANLGRNDQINLYDANGDLVERLTYGDESFPGTIRTQNKSGQVCFQSIGQNDIYAWQLAAAGDAFASHAATTGELGTPGVYAQVSCFASCAEDLDGDAYVNASDLALLLGNWGPSGTGDIDGSGSVDAADLSILLGAWGTCD